MAKLREAVGGRWGQDYRQLSRALQWPYAVYHVFLNGALLLGMTFFFSYKKIFYISSMFPFHPLKVFFFAPLHLRGNICIYYEFWKYFRLQFINRINFSESFLVAQGIRIGVTIHAGYNEIYFTVCFLFKAWVNGRRLSDHTQVWKIRNYLIPSNSKHFIGMTTLLFPPPLPPSLLCPALLQKDFFA